MNMLTPLRSLLTPRAQAAGFTPTDRASWKDLGWLEYRAAAPRGPVVLSVFHTPLERTVTVELWRPEQLVEALRAGVLEECTDRRRVWCYGDAYGPAELGREVVETVVTWLGELREEAGC